MKISLRHTVLGAALCAAGLCTTANAGDNDGLTWVIAPYIWGASISTNLFRDVPPTSISNQNDFGDIISKIDGAFMIHGEVQGDHFGAFADYLYLGLGDHHDYPGLKTSSQLNSTLVDLAAVWNPGGERFTGFELFGGLRYIDVNMKFDFNPTDTEIPSVRLEPNKSYSDFLLGVRYNFPLSERWGLTLRGDGSWGSSNNTWNTAATFDYKTDNGAWYFGYRYFDLSLDKGNITTDITVHGPQIGYGFKF